MSGIIINGDGNYSRGSQNSSNNSQLHKDLRKFLEDPSAANLQKLTEDIDKLKNSPNISAKNKEMLGQLEADVEELNAQSQQLQAVLKELKNPNLTPEEEQDLISQETSLSAGIQNLQMQVEEQANNFKSTDKF